MRHIHVIQHHSVIKSPFDVWHIIPPNRRMVPHVHLWRRNIDLWRRQILRRRWNVLTATRQGRQVARSFSIFHVLVEVGNRRRRWWTWTSFFLRWWTTRATCIHWRRLVLLLLLLLLLLLWLSIQLCIRLNLFTLSNILLLPLHINSLTSLKLILLSHSYCSLKG